MAKAALGIDVGGTYAKAALVSPSGRILKLAQLPTRPGDGPAAFVERAAGLAAAWRREGVPAVGGAGLGLAGDVDSARGRLRFAPNLRSWEGFDFRRVLSRRLGCSVVVDNDANLAVWGGYAALLKRRPRHVVGITLGTGVGGGLVLDGRLHRGATGSAGEIGHTVVAPGGEPCHCGARGCLEAYAGSYGIVRTARRLLASSRRPSSLRSAASLDPARIAAAADRGDAAAREVWRVTAHHLAVGIANIVLVINPEVVLLLGGVSRAGRWLLDPLRRELARQPFRTPFRGLRLRAAVDRPWGAVGAALLALEGD